MMRKAISVSALILALACSTYAGEMQNDTVPPTPPTSTTSQTSTTEGEIPTPPLQTLLNALGSVLGIL